jgi:site-specific recombinase XerD
MWCEGTVEGKYERHSLNTRSWERAEEMKRDLEDRKTASEPKEPDITVGHAAAKYYESCEQRRLSPNTLKKYRTVRDTVTGFARENGIAAVKDFTPDLVRELVKRRSLSALTAAKEIERLRTFFRFCEESEWIPKNPARNVRPPKARQNPRLPFSAEEVAKILGRCETRHETAFIRTLRHSGLRIGDCSLLRASDITDGRLRLRTTKSGIPVSILLPPDLVEDLKTLPQKGGYLFLIGESDHPHTASNLWRRRIKRMCKDAKISPDHPHRFRHTLAADLLMRGASIEDVAQILGNSPAIVIKHYAQWVSGRQDRLDDFMTKTWDTPKLLRAK